MRVGARFVQESKCPWFTAQNRVVGFGLKAQVCSYFDKSYFCFCLLDYVVCPWVSERYDGSVGYDVLYCCWDYGDVP